ncbi:MAG: phosphatidate cytidylyltransferase [Treponema sp.]|jgi:phosphatidate cytidylyltransferase|nr:phosphatidate cytidylyltransferase [Treponema sp.]
MRISKVLQRLLIFFIGIPVIIGFVYIDFKNHLPIHVLILLFSFVGADELYTILQKKHEMLPKPFILALSLLSPVCGMFCAVFGLPPEYITYGFTFSCILLFTYDAFSAKSFSASNTKIAGGILVIFYAGFLVTFISRITMLENSTTFLATFLFMVFICDSLAWLFGMLFGKNNRGVVAVSPNKSIAGFIGGFLGAIAAAVLSHQVWPAVFHGTVLKSVVLGLVIACSAIIGDLVESVFKRSAGVKDSGTIIPGRGGVLDSVDSIFASAPVFYILIQILYFRN